MNQPMLRRAVAVLAVVASALLGAAAVTAAPAQALVARQTAIEITVTPAIHATM